VTTGIILAGGRGSRLGPLAAQISKALVSVGQRPQVINQIEYLRDNGCGDIVVVASPDTHRQVQGVLHRAGVKAFVAVQHEPRGPVDAIRRGLMYADKTQDVTILFSDTVVTESHGDWIGDWFGIAVTENVGRPWCFHTNKWYDDEPKTWRADVAIGFYHFVNADLLHATCTALLDPDFSGELGMAPLLNAYPDASLNTFPSWQDIGDIEALINARRQRFISREHHALQLTEYGTLVKLNASQEECNFMSDLPGADIDIQALFPTYYGGAGVDGYEMEFIDLPTLAELWLYWPGAAPVWMFIIEEVISSTSVLWGNAVHRGKEATAAFYVDKAKERLQAYLGDEMDGDLFNLIDQCGEFITDQLWVNGHGDLQFTNILYSLNSGQIRLVDPRGTMVPLSYEFAKLAYSPTFSAITHGLFTVDNNGKATLAPDRTNESAAFDQLYARMGHKNLLACQALILLAACPLHSPKEAEAFYDLGTALLLEVVGE
jgi:hypothetical protein